MTLSDTRTAISTSLSRRDRPVTKEPKIYAAWTSLFDIKNLVTASPIDFKSRKAIHEFYTGLSFRGPITFEDKAALDTIGLATS